MSASPLCGFMLLDKPAGQSSFRATSRVRSALKVRKAGHAGTLDPFATGLLPIAIGPATRLIEYVTSGDKEYVFSMRLGKTTDTLDIDGRTTGEAPLPDLDRDRVRRVLDEFVGETEQVPPLFSALKVNGEALYQRARRGEKFDPPPRKIVVRCIELLDFGTDLIELKVRCGKGTYVRALARDIAVRLDTLGYVERLRRTVVEPFAVESALGPERMEQLLAEQGPEAVLLPAQQALPQEWPKLRLEPQTTKRLTAGDRLSAEQTAELIGDRPQADRFVLTDERGDLLAVLGAFAEGGSGALRLGPLKVINVRDNSFT
ncbi:MAG: tRNA pseudouridine(55) synthase TruB [Candidatus Alcyoniella australis]|nr:tRNA pseudouridine(55) synthase TruB [Candidatus Alcyoniella australis]